MKKSIYRVEFNEDQQMFHLADKREAVGKFGWEIIIPQCTDTDFSVFESFIGRYRKPRLSMKQVKKGYKDFLAFKKELEALTITFADQRFADNE